MADVENQLLIFTCDVLEYWHKQSLEEQKKEDEARKRRCKKGKIWTKKWVLRRGSRHSFLFPNKCTLSSVKVCRTARFDPNL